MNAVPTIPGVSSDWHGLSHHGKDPEKIEELKIIEEAEFVAFNEFLQQAHARSKKTAARCSITPPCCSDPISVTPVLTTGTIYQSFWPEAVTSTAAYVAHDAKNNTPLANLFVDRPANGRGDRSLWKQHGGGRPRPRAGVIR